MSGLKQPPFDLRITAFPRIHMTLIGMNSDGYRINGGIGFSITDPKVYYYFTLSPKFQLIDDRIFGFTIDEIERIKNRINQLQIEFSFINSIKCRITGESMTHYGLGTSTATYLSCIEALFILNNYGYNELLLQKISSRGGTSGIGINTYFNGGCVLDVGIPKRIEEELGPSSISIERNKLPLIIKQIKTPPWKVGIAIPKLIRCKSELEEVSFFKNTCPIDRNEVEIILYEVIYGSLSSLIENNFDDFCFSVNAIQKTKWKQEERNLYKGEISELEEILIKKGAKCVGMSSLGPGIYFLSETIDESIMDFDKSKIQIFIAEMNNDSRIIEYD